MEVIKRNGKHVPFDIEKIRNAIEKAFLSCGQTVSKENINRLLLELEIKDGISVEEIQDKIEITLLAFGYLEVAKSFMKYRSEHAEDRKTLEQLEFLTNYCKAENAATGSKYDANANVESKNIATLIGELPKEQFIRLNRKLLTNRIKSLYGKELANKYLDLLNKHFIYKNDETSIANYCASITMYPWLLNGTFDIGGNSKAPTNLKAFCGGFINMVFIVSSMLSGACLYKDAPLLIQENGLLRHFTAKDFITKYLKNPSLYSNYQGNWEYCDVSDKNLYITEDNKFTKVTKVMRRKYNDFIYKIKSANGNILCTSKDHKFKHLLAGRIIETKASDLIKGDTVFVNRDNSNYINYNSKDWKRGWIIGMLCGDGCLTIQNKISLSVNFEQEYLANLFNEYSNEIYGYTLCKYNGHRCWNYEKYSTKWYSEIKKDIIGKDTYTKHIDINNKSIEYLLGFLDGLLCADGSYTQGHSYTIQVSNKDLTQNVIDICNILNVKYKSSIYNDKRGNKRKLAYPIYIRKQILKYLNHSLKKVRSSKYKESEDINSKDIYMYSSTAFKCGPLKKTNKHNLWTHSNQSILYKTDIIEEITTFENDDEYVYEIETETHWYNSNGFITHNCATPEFLMYMDYFIRKEYGEDYWQHPEAQGDCSLRKRSVDKIITDCFEQIVYSINQPTGARNFQAVFWNISYYDKYYFQSLFEDFYFPDGTKPYWESLSWLQKRFMTWFNNERTKTVLTFPVETMAMLSENGKPKDEEWADFAAEMYSKGHSFFTYMSDKADSLSSCCFNKDTKFLWKSSISGVHCTTFEEYINMSYTGHKENFKVFHNGSWVKGRVIKLPNRPMYKVTTFNNKEFVMTDNHINVTLDGEKPTCMLTTDDYLMFNTTATQAIQENDEHLTYEQGFVIGAFLGDGCMGGLNPKTNIICDINFSQNAYKYEQCMKMLDIANKQVGGIYKSTLSTVHNNVYPIRISSKELVAFIQKWTHWERGTYAYNKKLNLNCLLQSWEFRKGILDGWYNTDGGNSNRCYTTSPELAEDMEILIMSLGYQSIINISDRTDEKVIIRGEQYNRNYPLYCVRWYKPGTHRVNKNSQHTWLKNNNSIYFRIKSIKLVDYKEDVYCVQCDNLLEPYFTLPCGLITHNCRLKNEIQDNEFSYTLGAGGISTGSKSVLTINLNRCIQYAVNNNIDYLEFLMDITDLCHKVQIAYNENLKALQKNGMLPLFDAGYINMKRQYLTIGINGMVEAAEFMGLTINNNDDYKHFVQNILSIIEKKNKEYRTKEIMFNCEMIPAENVGVKHAKWDKEDGYFVPRDCYNSYFYIVEDDSLNILDKFKLHGEPYIKHLTGGSALHMNLDEHLSKAQYKKLFDIAAKEGCNYFTFNIPNTLCNDCGYIDKRHLNECPKCHSKNIDYLTRIIGYLKRVSNFSKARQKEAQQRFYIKQNKIE